MQDDTDRLSHPRYLIRKKFFKLFGESFHIYDDAGNLVLYSKLKAFKIKEDIRLYATEAMERELLLIKARHAFDIATTYDVVDPISGAKVGALRRKGLKSMLRDEWLILDENDGEIGLIQEDSTIKALVRRVVDVAAMVMPQHYTVTVGGRHVATFAQSINPIIQKITLDFTPDTGGALDRRLGLAAGILMAAIEGRQE